MIKSLDSENIRGKERIAFLAESFPDVPASIQLKTDVIRHGVCFSDDMLKIARWALPQTHLIFEWDHQDMHGASDVTEGWTTYPQTFCLPDGTTIMIMLDNTSPYTISYLGDGQYTLSCDNEAITPIFFTPRPAWFTKRTEDVSLMCKVAGGNGECVFSVINVNYCQYFSTDDQCRYCTIVPTMERSRDLGLERLPARVLDRIVETFNAASEEGSIEHLCISGGSFLDRKQEADFYLQLIKTIRNADGYKDGMPILMATQAFDEADARRLYEAGEGSLYMSWAMETWDASLWPEIVPGKSKNVGREKWLDLLCQAVDIFGRGEVASNFVAGVELAPENGFKSEEEALASTLSGFEWLLKHDIRPAYSIWTVAPGSCYEDLQAPSTSYYVQLGKGWYDLNRKYGMPEPRAGCYKCMCYTTYRDFQRLCKD